MLVLAALLWGIAYSIQSISASEFGPYTVTFLKFVCSIPLFIYCLITKREFNSRVVFGGILIGIIVLCGTFLQQMGIEKTTVSKASFLSALYIMIVPIMEFVLGNKPKIKTWIAILIALLGAYLLCINESLSLNIGDIFVFLGAIFWAIQIILINKLVKDSDPLSLASIQQLTALIIATILMLTKEKTSFSSLTNNMVFPILYTVFLSGFLAETLQTRFQKDVPASLVSLLLSLESVFGALGGWLILNQTLTIKEVVGCVLIFIAILIAE